MKSVSVGIRTNTPVQITIARAETEVKIRFLEIFEVYGKFIVLVKQFEKL